MWRNFVIIVALLLVSMGQVDGQITPPPWKGVNPSQEEIRAKIVAVGQKLRIPPHILFGIAWIESVGWRQFDKDGNVVYNIEKDKNGNQTGVIGVGIMQVTVSPNVADYKELCINIDHNIERGAQILLDKWTSSAYSKIGDGIGEKGREKLENWYYAVWAYNGFVYNCAGKTRCNDPRSVDRSKTYQGKVFDIIANPAKANGQWGECRINEPTNDQIGPLPDFPHNVPTTPSPVHLDADFDGVIDGSPPTDDVYVDGGGGDDGHTGASDSPLKTLSKALGLSGVIRIHLRAGTYNEPGVSRPLRIKIKVTILKWDGSGNARIAPTG